MGEKGLAGGLMDYARRQPAVVIIVMVLVGLYASKAGSAASTRAIAVADVDFPAPSLLTHDRTTYVVGVDPRAPTRIGLLSSRDRRSWTVQPDALAAPPPWAEPGGGLGPAAIGAFGDSFVLYYTAQVRGLGLRCVSAATTKDLEEPFVDTSLAPFVCQTGDGGSTSPSPFVDAAGRHYLAWSSPGRPGGPGPALWAQRLRSDGLVLTGEPAVLLRPGRDWQQKRVAGPSMITDDGNYHLIYSAAPDLNGRQVVGDAMCVSPLGPCTAADKPILTGGKVGFGPGGAHAFTDARDRWWLGLHSWDAAPGGAYQPAGRFVVAPLKLHDDHVSVQVKSLTQGQVRPPEHSRHNKDNGDSDSDADGGSGNDGGE
ncbi:family 43 glycosylhydrolase [Frankia sp. AgKG'84/4]|uniref:family 43 glycosylhydrolase n=1 Tax=Frankia sp. AgKG'84/4 TaxID=573490 RepID=UPI00200CE14F|nr:family 43 glycosylhydrolase [Frankia sp. AgKG'84/4]MCL9794644.1 family 43 glycosylhydrolase [Frankia sp. AgKG'84/4]